MAKRISEGRERGDSRDETSPRMIRLRAIRRVRKRAFRTYQECSLCITEGEGSADGKH